MVKIAAKTPVKNQIKTYVPDTGDVVWLTFDPQTGREQKGHRPALVLSPASYNGKTSLMLCCPLTTQVKGYPFETPVGADGVALSDQIKSLDWRARKAKFKEKAAQMELAEVRAKIAALLGL